MLESIYGMRGGPSDALGRYLSNVGQKKNPAPSTQVDQSNSFANIGAGMSPGDFLGKGGPGGGYMVPGFSTGADGKIMDANAIKAAQQQQSGGAGPDLSHLSFDYSSDPVLMKMQAGGQRDTAEAEQQALDAKRSLAQQYGDKGFATSILGADDPTLGGVSDNPDTSTSTLARLKRAYAGTVKTNEDSMNENNLFYGGYRGKRLGDLAKDEQTQEADASSGAQAALGQIGSALAGAKQQISDRLAGGESDAASRKIQEVLAGIMAGGSASDGANGGTGDTTPPPATDTTTPPPAAATGASADTGAVEPAAGLFWDPVKQAWVQSSATRAGVASSGIGV